MRGNQTQTPRSADWIKLGLWLAFLLSAVITAVLALRGTREKTGGPELTPVPLTGIASENLQTDLDDDKLLQKNANRPGFKELDLDQTVYFLLTGLDLREWEEEAGPGLTDTIIVAFLNTPKQNAGLISIPRDTWVEVPEYGPFKINQAYSLGEAYGYPGGGPGILMETAGNLLDIEMDYYVQVDFQAFEVLVDAVNGVLVDVPEEILVWPNAQMEGDMKRLYPGPQVLPGNLALGYVRSRDTAEGDFGRTKRQQQVLVGLQKKLFSYEILPVLIPRLPGLYQDMATHVETNLTLNQIISLAWAVRDINPQSIHTQTINQPLVEPGINDKNQYVLYPNLDQIRKVWNDMQQIVATPIPEPTRAISPAEYMQQENAAVAVLNATVSSGLAGETADFLKANGINVTEVGNSDKFKDQTLVYDYTGNPYTIRTILDLMGYTENRLFYRSDPSITADIVIVLGSDWAQDNTLSGTN